MTSLFSQITNLVGQAYERCGYSADLGMITVSERPDLSQFQNTGALKGAKEYGKSPRDIAEEVAAALREQKEIFQQVQVDGPGFLNINLTDNFLAESISSRAENLVPQVEHPQTVVIDFGGPNVAKPMHVGHLRSSVVGESIKRINRAVGHTVYGDIHLGDWGTPMGMLIALISEQYPDLPYFDSTKTDNYPANSPVTMDDLERLYPEAANKFNEDAEFEKKAQLATAELQAGNPGYRALWRHFITVSEQGLKENFDALGVSFDWWYGESHYHPRIQPLIERLKASGAAVESEGALVIPLDEKDMPPLMLVKADGAFLYGTTDLACVEERVDENRATLLIYVVDQRQHLHFMQVFKASRLTGLAPDNVVLMHAGFGTMNGTDGKPFKTRAGGVMKLRDLIEMVTDKAGQRMAEAGISQDYSDQEKKEIAEKVGIAALKFGDLINNRVSNYVFDLDRFTSFEGKTGPYLIYTAVRIRSIFRKLGVEAPQRYELPVPGNIERPLMLALAKLPEVIIAAQAEQLPHVLAEHAFALAQEFNRFYQQTSIIHEEDAAKKEGWIQLSAFTLRQLELLLDLLGIEIPERM